MERKIYVGNALGVDAGARGWIIGHFMAESDDVRSTTAVEVKWSLHPAGDRKSEATANVEATNLIILVSSHFILHLADEEFQLERPGDYIVWGPGIPHRWHALADSVAIAVRWPSKPGDLLVVPDGR